MTVVNACSLVRQGLKVQICLAEEVGLSFPLCWYITDPEVLGAGPGMTLILLSVLCNLFHVNLLFTQQGGLRSLLCSVQLLSSVQLFATPWTAALQASLSITSSQSLLNLMSIELVMPSDYLILCHLLLLLPSIFPSIRVFSSESVLHIRWPK